MWIVLLALRRPYTFVVMSILIALGGILAIVRMPTDIFPTINIPVVSVIFTYTGISPDDMEKRIITGYERILTTTVNDIEHIESQSLNGIGIVKIFFQPGAKIEVAIAQVTAVSQTAIRQMPTGTQPPLVIQYNASNVPILQLLLGSNSLPEQQLFDQTVNFLRPQLITVPGVQIPYPYGGKQRQVMVDLEPSKLFAFGISPADISTAINNQNLILPSGSTKIGDQEYQVKINSSPEIVDGLNDLPIKTTAAGRTVFVKDVAHVRDGFSVQTNIVHSDNKRAVLLSILKSGEASTLKVVDSVKALLPKVSQILPPEIKVSPLFDQSVFVRASVQGVVKEGLIAAFLTALMILLFLGSWRSTLIVVISIPLSILVSIIILSFLGQTLNVMTLGGMALAVGILVDDATVEIENIHRNLGQKKKLVRAILDGAQQIAVPAFVSTLCICIVFIPVVFVVGAAKYLFTPLAMAVVFAMMTSYVLSRTLVPTMVHYLLAAEVEMYGGTLDPEDPHAAAVLEERQQFHGEEDGSKKSFGQKLNDSIWHIHEAFNVQFERLRSTYGGFLLWTLKNPRFVMIGFLGAVILSIALLFPFVGKDFFPTVDAGQIRLHVRAAPGTRLEQTEHLFTDVMKVITDTIPDQEIEVMLDNMGIPNSGINLSLSDGTQMSAADGEILISLKEGHRPISQYIRSLRALLNQKFPQVTFFFSPADIATQVLNFGLPAPIDIQLAGPGKNLEKNLEIAHKIMKEVARIPGAVDVRLQQVPRTPDMRINVDRTLANQIGTSQRDVASDVLISLSSSLQTAPNFWLNPQTGVNYSILVQTPQYKMNSLQSLANTPIMPIGGTEDTQTQTLGNLASISRGSSATNITHYNIQSTYDVLMGVQGADLGSVSDAVRSIVDSFEKELPRGSTVSLRGQIESMNASFTGLSYGLIFAIVLVYFLLVINFQSWIDPFIILMALPGALAGIVWMLFITGTTISVPALMGAIMSIGVATANSILMVTFANDQRLLGLNSFDAAVEAGLTRLRPVLMTALAMIIGMLPMSLGLGEGGEQNAPLGRAVIGGLLFATFATLFFVPVVYSVLRKRAPQTHVEEELR